MGFFNFLTSIEFIFLIYLFIVVNNLRDRLPPASSPQKASEVVPQQPEKAEKEEEPISVSSAPDPITLFFKWFARDWPLKVGALFVLLGVGWFLTYAFMNNLIGPEGRLFLGLSVGAAVMLFGNLRIKKNIYQGEILATLGAGILLATIFASEHMYKDLIRMLYPQWVSLLLVTLVIASLGFTSFMNKTKRLAILAYGIGAIAPFLVGFGRSDILIVFGYLLALTIGLIWLVRLTGWRALVLLPQVVIILYTLLYRTFHLTPDETLWMQFFGVTFTTVFYTSSLFALGVEQVKNQRDLWIGVLLSVYSYLWIIAYIPSYNQSLVLAAFALLFMSGAYVLAKMKSLPDAVFLYFVVSIIFLVTATLIQIKEPDYLSIVLAVESLLLFVFTDRVYSLKSAQFSSLLFFLPVIFSVQLFSGYSRGFSNLMYSGYLAKSAQAVKTYDFQLLLINGLLFLSAGYGYLYPKHEELKKAGKVIFVGSVVYSLLYLWNVLPYHIENLAIGFDGTVVALVIFAILGLGAYFYGMESKRQWTKNFGLVLSLFVIGRLLLIDVWNMRIEAKIITFIMVGVIFMLSVFLQFSKHEKQA
ncbi:MAG: DUF2339 domain-containing protein [Candidatus Levyibacteriota bacterium]